MKKYFRELHTKTPSHKKRFALLASGGVTLAIFAVWSFVRFGGEPQIAKDSTGPVNLAATVESSSVAGAFEGIKSSWQSLQKLISDGK